MKVLIYENPSEHKISIAQLISKRLSQNRIDSYILTDWQDAEDFFGEDIEHIVIHAESGDNLSVPNMLRKNFPCVNLVAYSGMACDEKDAQRNPNSMSAGVRQYLLEVYDHVINEVCFGSLEKALGLPEL